MNYVYHCQGGECFPFLEDAKAFSAQQGYSSTPMKISTNGLKTKQSHKLYRGSPVSVRDNSKSKQLIFP